MTLVQIKKSVTDVVVLFFIFIPIISFAQLKPQTPKIYNNKISKDHVSIPGTKLSLLLPLGFEIAKDFKGFRNSVTGSSIMISSIPGNINNNLMGFSKEALAKSGIFALGAEKFIINGFTSVLIKAKQIAYQNSYCKWMLIIGNTTETYLVNGAYLEKLEKEESKKVFESVMSVVFQPWKKVSAAEGFPFEINIKNTKLKATKLVTNSFIFTTDGFVPTKSKDKTTLTVSPMILATKVTDYKLYCINSLKQYNSVLTVPDKNISAIAVDAISGFEIFVNTTNQIHGKSELIYQTILFNGDMSYSIVGIAVDDFDENLKLFKSITRTFKLRK